MDFERIMEKAKETNKHRSEIDKKAGYLPPEGCTFIAHLRTSIQAIKCGIQTDDWDNVAEGLDLLKKLEKRLEGNS